MSVPLPAADDFTQVYWLGGSPCSGKSSIADALAEAYGFTVYRCDEAFFQHAKIILPEKQPVFQRVMGYDPETLWMRPVEQQVSDEIAIYREEFSMILEDLRQVHSTRPILLEGAALLPECVAPLLADPRRAMWVVPDAPFQMRYYSQREWAKDVVKSCSDPEQAFVNWMQRDIRFAQFVQQQAHQLGLRVLLVDGSVSLDETTAQVKAHFNLG